MLAHKDTHNTEVSDCSGKQFSLYGSDQTGKGGGVYIYFKFCSYITVSLRKQAAIFQSADVFVVAEFSIVFFYQTFWSIIYQDMKQNVHKPTICYLSKFG